MSVRLRKVQFVVHMDKLDADGNVVDELQTQQPLSLYAHQLDEFQEQVEGVVKQAEAQANQPDVNPR